jgi:tetratricopeptide (TPR) repeat protein
MAAQERAEVPLPELGADAAPALPGLAPERAAAVAEALRARDYARAEGLLVEAAERHPSPELLELLATVSFRLGNHLNAAIALKKAEARAPLAEASRFTLAMAYVALGRREWARPELDRLVRSAPSNALFRYWSGRLDYDAGRYADAVHGFQAALAADPAFVKAHDNLGLSYEALGRDDDARASFERAVTLNRDAATRSPWPPHNLGLLLTRAGREAEAEPFFREALRHDPRFAPAHYQLGVALEKTGRPGEAVPLLEEAARLDPGYPEPHYALARILRRQGRAADADRALETFQRLKKKAGPAGR